MTIEIIEDEEDTVDKPLPINMLLELCFVSYNDGQRNTPTPSFSIEQIIKKYGYYLVNDE